MQETVGMARAKRNKKSFEKTKSLIDRAIAELELSQSNESNKQVTLNLLYHCSDKLEKLIFLEGGISDE